MCATHCCSTSGGWVASHGENFKVRKNKQFEPTYRPCLIPSLSSTSVICTPPPPLSLSLSLSLSSNPWYLSLLRLFLLHNAEGKEELQEKREELPAQEKRYTDNHGSEIFNFPISLYPANLTKIPLPKPYPNPSPKINFKTFFQIWRAFQTFAVRILDHLLIPGCRVETPGDHEKRTPPK